MGERFEFPPYYLFRVLSVLRGRDRSSFLFSFL